MIDLTETLNSTFEYRQKVVGRYSVTDLFGISSKKTVPEKFFEPVRFSMAAKLSMWKGRWDHEKIQDLLKMIGHTIELKKEIKRNAIVVVGKADSLKDDIAYEIKSSKNIIESASQQYQYQIKAYCSMFEKSVGILVQPVIENKRVILREFGKVYRDDVWFDGELSKVEEFDKKIKKLIRENYYEADSFRF